MKFKLLLLGVIGVVPMCSLGQDVSGDVEILCLVSDSVAVPIQKASRPLVRLSGNNPCLNGIQTFHLGDHINVLIQHAGGADAGTAGETRLNSLVLFLDGKTLEGTTANAVRDDDELVPAGSPDEEDEDVRLTVLQFQLKRDLTSDAARRNWKQVISGNKFGKEVAVSLGLPHGEPVPSDIRINLAILSPGRAAWAVLIAVFTGLVFFVTLMKTGALRDKEPAGSEVSSPIDRAYSLSRVQAFIWTLLAVYAFLFVYWLTGEYNATIPGSIVTLMAISLGTLTTAAAVDSAASSSKQEKARLLEKKLPSEYLEMQRQKVQAENELSSAQSQALAKAEDAAGAAAVQDAKRRLDDLQVRIQADSRNQSLYRRMLALQRSATVSKTAGFWSDLFSNAGGAGLHRVQFGIWTLVLMLVFVQEVLQNVALPDFDPTLLALMGVSSGAYAGLKIPESKKVADDVPDTDQDGGDDEDSE